MLPKPDRNKIHSVVPLSGGRELLMAEVFGHSNENSMDNPGGGGGYNAFFTRDSKAKIQEHMRKEWNHICNLERRLIAVRKQLEIREAVVEQGNYRKSQEGTNSNK